jgi:hypothetical protein
MRRGWALLLIAAGFAVAAGARADGPPQAVVFCASLTGADLEDCRICQKRFPNAASGPNGWTAMGQCQSQLAKERFELSNLGMSLDRIAYETTPDADLDAIPDTSRPSVDRAVEILADLAGKRPSDAEKATAAESILAPIRANVAKEKTCRADKKCMEARAARKAAEQFFDSVVRPMCEADQAREAALAAMAHERANPSGYVNKTFLHDQGAIVQSSQDQLAAAGPAYVKGRHHPWKGWRPECTPPEPPP